MTVRWGVPAAITSLLLGALLVFAQATAPKPGRVTFTVVNSVTQVPISGLRIALANIRGGPPEAGISGADGREVFTVPPGDYYWSVSIGALYGFTVPKPSSGNLKVKEGDSVQVPKVALLPTSSIQGTVTDELGQPVAAAVVSALSLVPYPFGGLTLRESGYVPTDSQGRYRMTGVSPGTAMIRVNSAVRGAAGKVFPTTYYPSADSVSQAMRLQVPPGQQLEHIDVAVRRTGGFHVRGTLVLKAGAEKLRVQILQCGEAFQESAALGNLTKVQSDGSFEFSDVLPGHYCVTYRQADAARATIVLSYAATEVEVIDRDVERVQLIPSEPKLINGLIEVGEGERLPLFVYLQPTQPVLLVPAVQGEVDPKTGAFQIKGVLAAEYRWRAPVTSGYVESVKLGTRDVTNGAFTYAGESGPLTIRIAAARGSVRGKVTGASSRDAGQFTVMATPLGTLRGRRDLVKSAAMLANGEFQFPSMALGTYHVVAWEAHDPGWSEVPEFLERFQGTTVEVRDQQVGGVVVRLTSTGETEQAKVVF